MLYKEKVKRQRKAFWAIVPVVTLSLCLCALIDWLDVEFRWAFELAVLIVATGVIYYILRQGYYEYQYKIIDKTFVISQKIGNGEKYLFSVELKDILKLMPRNEAEDEAARLKLKSVPKYYVRTAEQETFGVLYFDETYRCEKLFTFKPTEQLLSILAKTVSENTQKQPDNSQPQ